MQIRSSAKSGTILTLNGGSSSIKFSVLTEAESPEMLLDGGVDGIGSSNTKLSLSKAPKDLSDSDGSSSRPIKTFNDAIVRILEVLEEGKIGRPIAVGHRIVHSGPDLNAHQEITAAVLTKIEQAAELAPLHAPVSLELIRDAQQAFPDVKHYACFDTVFHQTMPESSWRYALAPELETHGVRRYGFHGLSCESILPQLAGATHRLVIAHLGAGASVTAVRDGKSIHNTMGLTPCGGVVMGTRSGDLDPGLLLYLIRATKNAPDPVATVENALYKKSGLAGLSSLSGDMRQLHQAAESGNTSAQLAIEIFVNRVAMAIGAYAALLDGIDALVFTGGIGEHDVSIRAHICSHLSHLGLTLDADANQRRASSSGTIQSADSRIAVHVLPARENLTIAQHIIRLRKTA